MEASVVMLLVNKDREQVPGGNVIFMSHVSIFKLLME